MLLNRYDPRLRVYMQCCEEVADLRREMFFADAVVDLRQYRAVGAKIEAAKRRGHADLARQFGFEHVGPGSLCDLGRRRVVPRGCDNQGLVDHGEALRLDGVIEGLITHAYHSRSWLSRAAEREGLLLCFLPVSLHNPHRSCVAAILSARVIK
jgi:hypothetical protein